MNRKSAVVRSDVSVSARTICLVYDPLSSLRWMEICLFPGANSSVALLTVMTYEGFSSEIINVSVSKIVCTHCCHAESDSLVVV